MPEKSKPFLSAIKEEVEGIFADAYDQLAEAVEEKELLATTLKSTSKKTWTLMESKLKESYRNGQLAKQNGKHAAAAAADPEAPANPFRRS